MEFGALHCTPKNPQCNSCVLEATCMTRADQSQLEYPKKKGRVKVKSLYLYYFVYSSDNQVMLRKRKNNSIWANLYDFPSIECNDEKSITQLIAENSWLKKTINKHQIREIASYKHLLSHRKITATFYTIDQLPKKAEEMGEIQTIFMDEFDQYPVSKLVEKFWHNYSKEQAVGKHG